MSAILSSLSDIFGTAVTMLTDVVTAVTANPILLIFVLIGLVGLGVGMFKRLTRG